jgi:acetylornithine/N-succinyldiaminopimelate aminotransferase
VTWGALEKWYGFPRTPFDVSFMRRATIRRGRSSTFIDRDTAAVIVEPVQGVGGAYDLGRRCCRRCAALRRHRRAADFR